MSRLVHIVILVPALLFIGCVHTIDDSFTPPSSSGSISMKIVKGVDTPKDGASPKGADSAKGVDASRGVGRGENSIELDAGLHGKLTATHTDSKHLHKYKISPSQFEQLRHVAIQEIDEVPQGPALKLTQVDRNPDTELLSPPQKLIVSDLMIPKPLKSATNRILDPAVPVPKSAGTDKSNPVANPAENKISAAKATAGSGPVITSVNDLTFNNDPPIQIDPCLVCDCKESTSLLNCNRRNLNNNYTSLLASPLLSYKYTTVCLSNNNIEKITQFPRLEQITRLCLSNNPIKEIQDGVFKKFPNLVSLDMSHTKLSNFILTPNVFQGNYAPDSYEPLKSLKILNLSNNNFHSLNSDLFEHLPNLEELRLSHNPFTVLDMPTSIALSSIPLLKILDLSNTGLSSLPNHLLHTPRYLHTLNLSFNEFKSVPDQLAMARELQVLNLNGNPIPVITSFPVVSKLHTLSLSFMPELESLQAGSLSNLAALQSFTAANNSKLAFIHAGTFSRTIMSEDGQTRTTVWPPLDKLVLSNNALQRLDGTLVARWDKLQVLDIRYNPWLCDCDNQWLVSSLLPLLEANHPQYINNLKCRDPIEMANMNLLDLDHKGYRLRCLDLYNHRPETDSILLIISLLFALLAVPLLINLVLCARRRASAPPLCPNVHYSRAFYKSGVRAGSSDVISTHYIL